MNSRPYREGDLLRMLDFLAERRAADPDGDYEHVGDLQWRMRLPGEPDRSPWLWEDGHTLVGYAAREGGGSVTKSVLAALVGAAIRPVRLRGAHARAGLRDRG